jgi:hypothetical protein
MLVIRPEQMVALEAHMEKSFEARLARAIEGFFPDEIGKLKSTPEGETQFRATVRTGIARADTYGIELEADIATFVALAIANSYLTQPGGAPLLAWTRPIIEDRDMAGATKMALIAHKMRRFGNDNPRARRVSDILRALRG